MSFRTSDKLQRYEKVRFSPNNLIIEPGNNGSQKKTGYTFRIPDRSNFYDFFKGYFEVNLELQKKADGSGYAAADRITLINGSHSLIKRMTIKSAGKVVYVSDDLHRITNVKNLLEYSNDFTDSVAQKSFWHLDTENSTANTNLGFEKRRILTQANQNNGGGGAKNIHTTIPLNRYSFFQELEDEILPPMQLEFEIDLNEDEVLIHMANGTDPGRVVVKQFYLLIPKMVPKDSKYDEYVKDFLKPVKWTYLQDLHVQSAVTRIVKNEFRISPAIDNVRHVFFYLQRNKGPNDDESERTPHIFDTFKLNAADNNSSLASCRLEYGKNTFYPEVEYDADSKLTIFDDLMSYSFRDYNMKSGTQLNPDNFSSIYGLVYFNLTYQKETPTQDPKPLFIHYRLNVAPTADVVAHAIVFNENEFIINKVGNELMIA